VKVAFRVMDRVREDMVGESAREAHQVHETDGCFGECGLWYSIVRIDLGCDDVECVDEVFCGGSCHLRRTMILTPAQVHRSW